MKTTDFLILTQTNGGFVIDFIDNIAIAKSWLENTSDHLWDWMFKEVPDCIGIFIVTAEVHKEKEVIEIRRESWRLACISDFSRFGISINNS